MDATVVVVDDVGAFFCGSMTSKSSSKMLDERTFLTTSDRLLSSVCRSHCGSSRWMVPLWMWPMAVVCGNTFVLKPSEKVPLSTIRITEFARQAGLPPGVLNVVHGGREAVDALLNHLHQN